MHLIGQRVWRQFIQFSYERHTVNACVGFCVACKNFKVDNFMFHVTIAKFVLLRLRFYCALCELRNGWKEGTRERVYGICTHIQMAATATQIA